MNEERSFLEKEFENKNHIYTNLLVEMRQNEEFHALEEQKRRLSLLMEQKQKQEEEKKELLKSARRALRKAERLTTGSDIGDWAQAYVNLLQDIKNVTDVVAAKDQILRAIETKKAAQQELNQDLFEITQELFRLSEEQTELTHKIKKLGRQRLSYPKQVELLQEQIEQEFVRIGRTEKPKILCELLEITNEKWRNAVEGYLNTQRFYVLVEPQHFDIALGIYEKLRREKKVYGVGLINTGKLDGYDTTPADSLAQMVESKNQYAKRFINMILGKVHICNRTEELKQYKVSITAGCMCYQNHVANAIRPAIYEKPYIGQNAIKIQLEQAGRMLSETEAKRKECTAKEARIKDTLINLEYDVDTDIKYKIDVLSEIRRTNLVITQCEQEVKRLEKNTTLIEKQIQVEQLQAECKQLQAQVAKKDREIGSSENKMEQAEQQKQDAASEQKVKEEALLVLSDKYQTVMEVWKAEYQKQTADKTIEQFRFNFDRRKKANLTLKEKANDKMTAAMVDYKTAFDFGAGATYEAYPEYAAVQDRLETSELLKYEDRVTKARSSAEEEFREQFLSKLQENVKQAQGEFKELNKALKDIAFSSEKYQFLYLPSKRYGKYYDMIMDDFNVVQGESIFSGIFHENHKEVIDELFAKLALDQENSTKSLDEFTDYRTYMDYDIKIIHDDDSFSYYSKVCEEKSGGETQTPFYVTVAASFVQLYSNNIGGESIGLVMFDEAFNNMDDERIGGVLEFLNRLPLQLVIAAPPDKIQYIGPKMDETLLVMADNKTSYVEEYGYASNRKTNIK